ncbi:YceI family protein [Oceanihabitans sediminis]|uniref:Polyisoprenoid-binding protein n=1 Tax=Oceanihabitans sediminis TaxID=1812012 RepID=A0A368P2I2_9FLAO|nr:YceI family protein [Oceanihabitans sediminis]MDX1279063.1 YceI family protein [Oceanihabitans sediminis]RBP28428.1 polyisoprenoid-binding protein YceI [Oceanihabitans sediminis]RCU56626.1 polyisoprenoid-binding protein [Oceanihabitans sediminis]
MSKNTNWSLDNSHSEIAFKVKHMMISTVTGHFEDFEASAKTDGDDFKNADFSFSAKTASINTKNKDRDTHLRSDDFFNSEKFPEMKFVSKSFDGEKLVGDLTIRDITKEVVLDAELNGIAEDPYGQTKAGFEMTGTINRKDFNLTWSAVTEAGSIVVSDKVKMVVDVQFTKQA